MENCELEHDPRVDELNSLIALSVPSSGSKNCGIGTRKYSIQEESAGLRHVRPERLREILSKMNLRSLLYSPLDQPKVPVSKSLSCSSIEFFKHRKLSALSRKGRSAKSFDVAVKSLSHKFSVYGHRHFNLEDEDFAPSPVYCAMVEKSGRFVVSGADDHLIKVWNVQTGLLVATLLGHTAEICDMMLSPCMQYITSLCSDDWSVVIWKKSSEGVFKILTRLVETDPSSSSGRKLKPLYMDFSPSEHVPQVSHTLKFAVAYTNGTIIVHEFLNGSLIPFNRVTPYERMELKSFAQIRSKDPDVLVLLSGVSRGSSKAVICHTVRSRGSPKEADYAFPSTIKSAVSHISVANHSASFVANDDEVSSVILWRDGANRSEYEKISLLKGLMSGDAVLVDGSSLIGRLRETAPPGVAIQDHLRITVDLTVWTKNDEFILCSVSGKRRSQLSIGQDEEDHIYCCLIFDAARTGMLVGVIGLGVNTDHIFNLSPIAAPPVENWSYFATASYDGSIKVFKIKFGTHSNLLIHELTGFNINSDRGSNRPRSVLDLEVLEKDDGHVILAASDSRGGISVFSTENSDKKPYIVTEQFFQNDYIPVGSAVPLGQRMAGTETETTRTTTVATGGIICDSRIVPVSQLEVPSPPVVDIQTGTGFSHRFNGHLPLVVPPLKPETGIRIGFACSATVAQAATTDVPRGPVGRPRLTDEERQRRAESLRQLAAARAARVDHPDNGQEEYTRTASGRIVRRMSNRALHEDELDLYENSEIDDSTFSSSSFDSDASETRPTRRSSRNRPHVPVIFGDDERSPSANRRSRAPLETYEELIPVKLRADQFLKRARELQSRPPRSGTGLTCTLCSRPELLSTESPHGPEVLMGQLLGPFAIADLPDSFFHSECLFTLSGLLVMPAASQADTLTFGNLERLVHSARRSGRCAFQPCINRLGAGIKCSSCRLVFHYPCALQSAVQSGWLLDPLLDNFFLCPRCEPPSTASGLESFSRRRKWRCADEMREWLLSHQKQDILKGTFVPQIGDMVYYYPPKLAGGDSGSLRHTRTALAQSRATVGEVCGNGTRYHSAGDLALLTWWGCGCSVIPARVDKIEYVFPGFFDAEKYSVIQKLTLTVVGGSADVTTAEGLTFTVHYRPKPNASDFIVHKDRVDRALSTRFHSTARTGSRVNIPLDAPGDRTRENDGFPVTNTEGTIVEIYTNPHRPGWECFQIKEIDDDGAPVLTTVSLWELDLESMVPRSYRPQPHLVVGPTSSKAQFLIKWLDRVIMGSVKNARNRINIPEGMSIFNPPPWETEGASIYLEVIAYPMWLELVEQRLQAEFYRSTEELKKDIECISQNCAIFNDPNSQLVQESHILVNTLLMLVDIPESDHTLYHPPPPPQTTASPESIRARPVVPVEAPEPVRTIRVSKKYLLVCDHCGAKRDVQRDLYDDFTDSGKRVKCRWIGYTCDASQTESPPAASRRVRSQPPKGPAGSRTTRSGRVTSRVIESSSEESDDINEVSSEESDDSRYRRRSKRRRRA